jgi:hypothetical protein
MFFTSLKYDVLLPIPKKYRGLHKMTRKQRKSTGNEKRVNVSQGSVHIEKKRQHEIEIKKKHLRDLISSLVTSELPKDQLYHAFRTIATTKGGFLSDEFRQKIWPFLLLGNYSLSSSNERRTIQDQKKAHYSRKVGTHRDEIQLNKDIERSLWYFFYYYYY